MPTKRKPYVLSYTNPQGGSEYKNLSVRRIRAERLFSKLRNQYNNARLLSPKGERVA